jgi:hypothetical protein
MSSAQAFDMVTTSPNVQPEVTANFERPRESCRYRATSRRRIGVELVGSETNTHAGDLESRALQRWENEGGRCDDARAMFTEGRDRWELRKSTPEADRGSAHRS